MNTTIPGLINSEYVRSAFPVLSRVNYLNVGTYGIVPDPALAEFNRLQSEFEIYGVASSGETHRTSEAARGKIANLIHADIKEIAFTRNATDGINIVLAGIDWQPGDEVITTDEEHEAMIHPLLYLQRRKGIKFHRITTSPDPQTILDQLENLKSPRTKLVAMSLVSCETGTRLPAVEISSWAGEKDILTLLDGAQASGAFPIDVKHIGCDFYTSNGHKWLSAPKGTGFFFIRNDKLDSIYPAFVGAGSLEKADIDTGTAELWDSALRFEFGTRSWAVSAGLKASLDWFEQLGWENVYEHIESLSSYLKERIERSPVMESITPQSFDESSGLTTFIVKGFDAGEISKKIRESKSIHVARYPTLQRHPDFQRAFQQPRRYRQTRRSGGNCRFLISGCHFQNFKGQHLRY